MSEADIVFTTVASIHPFCGENAQFSFGEPPRPSCMLLVGPPSRWPAVPWPRQSHSRGDGTQAEQGQKWSVTYPSGGLSTGMMEIITLLIGHPLPG